MEDSGIDSGDPLGDVRVHHHYHHHNQNNERRFPIAYSSSADSEPSTASSPTSPAPSNANAINGGGASGKHRKASAAAVAARRSAAVAAAAGKYRNHVAAQSFHHHPHHQHHPHLQGLIPIDRISIPGGRDGGHQSRDQQPLVQWDTDDSEEDIVNFFPLSRKESKVHHHQELTDTFSIEELSISENDDEEEEDLHLVPPSMVYKNMKCCPSLKCTLI